MFSSGDGFANVARMIAVKSFRHGFFDALRAKIVREHRRPRDRLQQRPMRAKHRREREDEKDFAEPLEHADKLNRFCKTARMEKLKS